MELPRREFLKIASGAAISATASDVAAAPGYPARPVHIIVGFAAGGATDIIARVVAQALAERLDRQFIVENRPGASTNLATEMVVRAPADGYTLLLIGPPAAINATLYTNLSFDFVRDVVPVAALVRVPYVVVVEPSFPAKTMAEFIAYAKAHPGKVSMATPGIGTGPEMAGALLEMMAGIDMLTVRYRGDAPSLSDLLGRHVDMYFCAMPSGIELIRSGKIRPLAVTTAARSALIPDVPALGELLPGFEASWLSGVGAPKNTPADIIETLNREINSCLADPAITQRLAQLGGVPLRMTSAEYAKLITGEIEKWGNVIRTANIKPN